MGDVQRGMRARRVRAIAGVMPVGAAAIQRGTECRGGIRGDSTRPSTPPPLPPQVSTAEHAMHLPILPRPVQLDVAAAHEGQRECGEVLPGFDLSASDGTCGVCFGQLSGDGGSSHSDWLFEK